MKRIALIALLATAWLGLSAQTLTTYVADSYTGTLSVTIDGVTYQHELITIGVKSNGTDAVDLSLTEFKLVRGSEVKQLGNICLTAVALTKPTAEPVVNIVTSQQVTIADPTATSTDPDDPNSATGSDQEAADGWGNDDDDPVTDDKWHGPEYGPMTITASGSLSIDTANLSFSVYIPSSGKTVTATFTTPNVSTAIAPSLQRVSADAPVRYTPAGIRVPKSYRGPYLIVR